MKTLVGFDIHKQKRLDTLDDEVIIRFNFADKFVADRIVCGSTNGEIADRLSSLAKIIREL